jgi:hypothetical protein
MKNNAIVNGRIGVWLILIVVLGILNALGDICSFFWVLGHSSADMPDIISLNMYFFHISASRTLFLIAMPISLVSCILFLVFIGIRKLFLFKLFFFIACGVALGHLLINAVTIHPFMYFEVPAFLNMEENLIAGMLVMPFQLLQKTTTFFIYSGISIAFGVLIVCMVYFKRSKRVALYFGGNHA